MSSHDSRSHLPAAAAAANAMALNTKRAYKLQEFVAHSSNVNCLKIGRKTSRVLLTGGEDHKVNLWAIGKPNSILSLSGHTSPVESVNFDSAEVLVAAGAASGTIKLWDLEEAKIVRTLAGHRSNCMSVDFHPFGEFFASGSLDTNLKIWDIRRKGCIHTYKGHTRGVNAIRFTPDGRWVVSGGEDNAVKIWDLTAGKLLQDFKCHEGQIQCIDFHPYEFLLATGSADKTVKFWDLETFEMIGSTVPEGTGIRSMTFNPDGRSLLCGFHESLKVFSWEPIICHDDVDVGWSRLCDLNVHEGKLIGCSFNQSCVGVWVVDLSRVEPYATGNSAKLNGQSGLKVASGGNMQLQNESGSKAHIGRLSVVQNSENDLEPSLGRLSVSQNSDSAPKETKPVASSGLVPSTPRKTGIGSRTKTIATSALVSSGTTLKRNLLKNDNPSSLQAFNKADVVPIIVLRSNSGEDGTDSRTDAGDVIPVFPKASRNVEPAADSVKGSADVAPAAVPRTSTRMEMSSDSTKEPLGGRVLPYRDQSRYAELRKLTNAKVDSDRADNGTKHREPDDFSCQIFLPQRSGLTQTISSEEESSEDVKHVTAERSRFTRPSESNPNYCNENYGARIRKPKDNCYIEVSRAGRMRSTVSNWDSGDQSPSHEGPTASASSVTMAPAGRPYSSRGRGQVRETPSITNDEGMFSVLMEHHELFLGSIRSRLTKFQIVRQMWERKDVRGAVVTMEKMSDHAVSADVVSVLMERSEAVTLDLCACLLPILTDLLGSKTDRHLVISLEMLVKLVRTFGPVIHSTVSAGPSSVGVDLQAEERRERCNLCFIELEKVKSMLPSLTRRKGAITNTANELNLALQEVMS